jgi:hypothetical protein
LFTSWWSCGEKAQNSKIQNGCRLNDQTTKQGMHKWQLCTEYISIVLLPCIDELRSNEEFADKEAVLLMDNCPIHVRPETLQMLADHSVKANDFLPHTSHIFQNLIWVFSTISKRKWIANFHRKVMKGRQGSSDASSIRWSRLWSKIMFEVFSCSLDFDMILT